MTTNVPEEKRSKLTKAPGWFWIIAGVGLFLIVSSIAFMIYEGIAGDTSPPDVSARVDSIRPAHDGYHVMFRVINHGGIPAEGVSVEAELRSDTGSVETSSTTIEFVPSHSERAGGFFFTEDPREKELSVRVLGYEEP